MVLLGWIIGVVFGIGIGGKIATSLAKNKCKHKWELIESGNIINKNRYGEKIYKGFIKVYECCLLYTSDAADD